MAGSKQTEHYTILATTVCTVVSYLLQIVAMCTDYWFILLIPRGYYRNSSGLYMIKATLGLWRVCRVEVSNVSDVNSPIKNEYCEPHNMFPSKEQLQNNPEIDAQLIDYMRIETAFSVISIFLMFLVHIFAFYSFKRPRYVIKRLTALLYMMTAACLLVLNEVYIKSVDHGIAHIPARHPKTADYNYGFSFILSWISFVIYFLAGCIFLFISHKRKSDMADDDDELAEQDEPMRLGRI